MADVGRWLVGWPNTNPPDVGGTTHRTLGRPRSGVPLHAAAFNVGLLMRVTYGPRKPRSLSAAAAARALLFEQVDWLGLIRVGVNAIRGFWSVRRLVPQGRATRSAAWH